MRVFPPESFAANMGSQIQRSTHGAKKNVGVDVSEVRRLKALEDENARFKTLLAETLLDASAQKIALSQS
jgi:hypothetical protein